MGLLTAAADGWRCFSREEKRNIAIYISGIMLYKFGLEAFNGSILALATNRYDDYAVRNNIRANTFERVGLLAGLNQAFQCVGSILIAPLIKVSPSAPRTHRRPVGLMQNSASQQRTCSRWPS